MRALNTRDPVCQVTALVVVVVVVVVVVAVAVVVVVVVVVKMHQSVLIMYELLYFI